MHNWRRLSAIGASLLAIGACGATAPQQADSSKPAHCVAAFTYARELALSGKRPDLVGAVESTARALFEGKKMKAAGTFESGRKEGEAFFAAHGADEKVMMPLLLECAKRQDADPAYRVLNDSGELIAAAKKADPACRKDVTCRSSVK